MSRSEREKGARFEREIVEIFKVYEPKVRRALDAMRQREEGLEAQPDLEFSGVFCVQCRRRKNLGGPAVQAWIDAAKASRGNQVPLGVVRRDGDRAPLAIIRLEDLLRLTYRRPRRQVTS